jgi:hypothetical protein
MSNGISNQNVSPDKGRDWLNTPEEIAGYAQALAQDAFDAVVEPEQYQGGFVRLHSHDFAEIKYSVSQVVYDCMLKTCQTGEAHLPDQCAKAADL